MTERNKQPYVRFFASDWLAGTRGMRAAEVGVYITLIALMYERCEPLPENHKRLARQCGCDARAFKNVLDDLVEDKKIIRTECGIWNKRVQREFDFRGKKSSAAKDAAATRWEKDNKNNDPSMQTHSERNANGMPYQKPEAKEVTNVTYIKIEREKEFHDFFWPAYPHKVAKPNALKAFLRARKRAPLNEILAGLERYKSSKPPDISWAHPATWLNADRWADEPAHNLSTRGPPDKPNKLFEAIDRAVAGEPI